jgi:hypothetical protein
MFTLSLNVCVNGVEKTFISHVQFWHCLSQLSYQSRTRMQTGLKLPSRASVVRAGVTGFVLLSFCQHATHDRDKPAFDEPSAFILKT